MGKREHIYEIIAENIRKERRRLGITQAELAERADVSLDTIKSVENGRRAMSLDTYLNIVHALESSPTVLMSQQHPEKHIERFAFMMNRCDEREIEFALHMIEQILRGQEDYLSDKTGFYLVLCLKNFFKFFSVIVYDFFYGVSIIFTWKVCPEELHLWIRAF